MRKYVRLSTRSTLMHRQAEACYVGVYNLYISGRTLELLGMSWRQRSHTGHDWWGMISVYAFIGNHVLV